ncbi:hypothetical protein COY25_00775 [Candidatus Uhrbacteria bacterium CG_4_10_14_0_2_um_filter_41_7]|uniref:Uncharacterized protein n=1 Tax=Candidatus Uhrbacteria bacterium CG_4_9_14_3_um_filter_41_35 TaxID=1975034 RepID=A0A2M7XGK4_9BACT|nr:MAG: hypothetical protein COV92_03430 [Candidatus Uhrbacteria bacterium CG11_big_fil_rev_8_21_14_0_20_41_9]PIZ55561.1 MAG: hypothetical protein COY25_00775 [Candidatus Uhrbacteria bacterium CG_4_10_14_0_2_um_filter_41_7]PJA46985.1 MAG: hypothetical protein CO173_00625 [Candidatus Uhrbacteria bacterium CG_4_9_14_3_um_filter_41_35]
MANRNMEHQRAIADSAAAGVETETNEFAKREDFKSRYVYEAVGMPKDPVVLEAVDKWANVCGDVIYPTMKDEGLYDENEPGHKEALEELTSAQEELAKLLPDAHFQINVVTFENGHIQLSTS